MDSDLIAELSNNHLGHREEDLKNLGIKTFIDMARFSNETLRTVLFFTRAEILHFESLRDVCINRIHAKNRQQPQSCAPTALAHLYNPVSMTGYVPSDQPFVPIAKDHSCYNEPMRRDAPRIMTETSTFSQAHPSYNDFYPFQPDFNPPVETKSDLPHATEDLKSVGFGKLPIDDGDPIPKEMREVRKMQESYSICTTSPTKGIGLIIMNNKFEGHGVEEEGKSLRSLFKKMGLEIKLLTNRTREAILSDAKEIAKQDHSGYSLLVVGICTNCEDGDMLYASYGVYSLNNDLMPIFKPPNCRSLKGKPKIFLINSCNPVQAAKEVFSDDVVAHGTTDESDFLVVHSTVMRGKGFTNFHCCFIAILEKTFVENRDKHLLEIIRLAHNQCKPVEAEGVGSQKYVQKCRRNSTLTKPVFIPK